MSKIEEAYSLEFEDVIDAEKAYELFWNGYIKDKRAFECTDSNCSAQITCVNIDKKKSEMKRIPYFKYYGEHSKECEMIKAFKEVKDSKAINRQNKPMKYINNKVDILMFNRPKTDNYVKKSNDGVKKKNKKEVKENLKKQYIENGSRSSSFYSIKPLISKFEKYKSESLLDSFFININNFKISYKSMFINIADINYENIESYNRIYFGIGKIFKSKNNKNEFVIFLKKSFKDEEMQTIICIKKETIDRYYRSEKIRNELEGLVSDNEKQIIFYIYSRPIKKYKTIYLNISNMDFIDYRIIRE